MVVPRIWMLMLWELDSLEIERAKLELITWLWGRATTETLDQWSLCGWNTHSAPFPWKKHPRPPERLVVILAPPTNMDQKWVVSGFDPPSLPPNPAASWLFLFPWLPLVLGWCRSSAGGGRVIADGDRTLWPVCAQVRGLFLSLLPAFPLSFWFQLLCSITVQFNFI